jgi:hypothetical protein
VSRKTKTKRVTGGAGRLRPALLGGLALLALAIPAAASAHPAVYDAAAVAIPTPPSTPACDYANYPDGECLQPNGLGAYVVVNHNIPVGYEETNQRDAGDGGVINFKRFPKAFRETIPANEPWRWLTVKPASSGVQPHATCASSATSDPETIVGWQGAEPFYAYIPWQDTAAGIDDDPADWVGYVKDQLGVDLTGMSAVQAEAACEGALLNGTYFPADTPFAKSVALHLIEDEVGYAVTPLQAQIDSLLGEKSSLQSQIETWKSRGGSLVSQLATLSGDRSELSGKVRGLRRANARKAKRIKALRAQLREARQHG